MPASGASIESITRLAVRAVAQVGARVFTVAGVCGELSCLTVATMHRLCVDRQRRGVLFAQMYRIGFLSLPVVILTGISMALVLAIQGYGTLRGFNAENITGGMVNFTIISQIMPVLAGLVLAGRVGASIAAELGTMQVTEQIDALRVMGTDPISYLVAPRFLACVLLMPLMTAIGAVAGMYCAAALIIGLYGVDSAAYWHHTREFVTWWEIVTGLGKTFFYGAIIALVACRKGLRTEGGATGVGEACTGAVVHASMLILFGTFLLTVLFQRLYELLFSG